MSFNCYEDDRRAEAYARLEFPGTYYLAYRDLPAILARHAGGRRAVDFGCGAGRSTRFLRGLGYEVTGLDVSEEMIRQARARDPEGDYRLIERGELPVAPGTCDLALSVFTFDNIPTAEEKVRNFGALARLLGARGRIVSLVSTPDVYTHEWASFSTRDFPENRRARRGDVVRTVITAIADRRPVEDVLWPEAAYHETYAAAGLEVVATEKPLGRPDEPYPWVTETRVAPWAIYVLRPVGRAAGTAA